jgi:hypothetical protein
VHLTFLKVGTPVAVENWPNIDYDYERCGIIMVESASHSSRVLMDVIHNVKRKYSRLYLVNLYPKSL